MKQAVVMALVAAGALQVGCVARMSPEGYTSVEPAPEVWLPIIDRTLDHVIRIEPAK